MQKCIEFENITLPQLFRNFSLLFFAIEFFVRNISSKPLEILTIFFCLLESWQSGVTPHDELSCRCYLQNYSPLWLTWNSFLGHAGFEILTYTGFSIVEDTDSLRVISLSQELVVLCFLLFDHVEGCYVEKPSNVDKSALR